MILISSKSFGNLFIPLLVVQKKSKIFIASTPNGTDNLFYRLYQGALQGDNNWKAERIDWWEIPGRDEKWKADTVRTLGSQEIFDQEFGNQFLQGGESSVDENLYNKMQRDIREPYLIFDENRYVVFDEPKENRLYTVGVDIVTVEMIYYDWTPESMLEVTLPEPDNFLKVRETLTRIVS